MAYDMDADPVELRAMATALRIFSDDMGEGASKLDHLFNTIEWDDHNYVGFKGNMVPVLSMLRDVAKVADETMNYCSTKAEIVERYQAGGR